MIPRSSAGLPPEHANLASTAHSGKPCFHNDFKGFCVTVRFPVDFRGRHRPMPTPSRSGRQKLMVLQWFPLISRLHPRSPAAGLLQTPLPTAGAHAGNHCFYQGFSRFSGNRKIFFYFDHRARARATRKHCVLQGFCKVLKVPLGIFLF